MSQLKVNSIVPAGGLPSGSNGGIIQVKQTLKTDAFSMNSNSFTDVTGMTVAITPSSNSNKILIRLDLCYGGQGNLYGLINLYRGSTHIGASTAVSLSNQLLGTFGATCGNNDNDYYKLHNANYQILDSPATTSAVTYKIQVYSYDSRYFYLNRPYNNDNSAYIHGGSSSITAYEVSV
tara:strand:+ start:1782 stop:2315 length:534 start_codon:yes stop_codon:yes gene_type:complete